MKAGNFVFFGSFVLLAVGIAYPAMSAEHFGVLPFHWSVHVLWVVGSFVGIYAGDRVTPNDPPLLG